MTRAYLGLGSNLGDRPRNLEQALALLAQTPGIEIVEASSFYESEPVGDTDQDWFVNAVAAIETPLPAEALMQRLLAVESELGRVRDPQKRFGPRIIDLDLLFYGDALIQQAELTVPHPRLHERAFVLVPLLELNEDLRHPVLNRSIAELHLALENPEEVLLYGTRLKAP